MFVQLVVEDLKEKTIWNHICVLIEIVKEHSTSLNIHYNRQGGLIIWKEYDAFYSFGELNVSLGFALDIWKCFAVVYVDDSESVVERELF